MSPLRVGVLFTILVIGALSNKNISPVKIILESFFDKPAEEVFKIWHLVYNKHNEYSLNGEESEKRSVIFKENLEEVRRWNSNPDNTWKKAINNFSDMTQQEFKRTVLTKLTPPNDENIVAGSQYYEQKGFRNYDEIVPYKSIKEFAPIDWKEASGAVEDQKTCGSCYAFATLNAIETQYFIQSGKRVGLSKQQVVDCSPFSNGCDGGWPSTTALYAGVKGLHTEEEYPYTAKKGICMYRASSAKTYVSGLWGHDIPSGWKSGPLSKYHPGYLYEQLKKGPVVAAIDASGFHLYSSGIWHAQDCFNINHAVLIVGYGVDTANQSPYWVGKNTWGSDWGEDGYIRIAVKDQDVTGNCFLEYFSFVPFYESSFK